MSSSWLRVFGRQMALPFEPALVKAQLASAELLIVVIGSRLAGIAVDEATITPMSMAALRSTIVKKVIQEVQEPYRERGYRGFHDILTSFQRGRCPM